MRDNNVSLVLSIWATTYLALAGCAGSGPPQQYNQGAVVAPRAPVFNPAMDASVTTGQPGYVAPAKMPRSHYGRVLPETRRALMKALEFRDAKCVGLEADADLHETFTVTDRFLTRSLP